MAGYTYIYIYTVGIFLKQWFKGQHEKYIWLKAITKAHTEIVQVTEQGLEPTFL